MEVVLTFFSACDIMEDKTGFQGEYMTKEIHFKENILKIMEEGLIGTGPPKSKIELPTQIHHRCLYGV